MVWEGMAVLSFAFHTLCK